MELGQEIEVKSILRRVKSRRDSDPWTYLDWIEGPLEQPRTGIVIGKRTLSNGFTSVEPGEGILYTPTDYINVLLVVFNLKENPVKVLIDNE